MQTVSYKTSIEIEAPPAIVFPYLTDPDKLLRWMGSYSVLDARPGGEFTVNVNGVPVRGAYLEVNPPSHVLLSWGWEGSDRLPPGASTVHISLTAENGHTLLELEHRELPEEQAAAHELGWTHYLDRLVKAGAGGDPGPDPWESEPPVLPESVRSWAGA